MILITGASGTVGRAVRDAVVEIGAPYRAMVRSEAEAAKLGSKMEVAVGDFANRTSLVGALAGVDSVFLVCSPIPELVELETNMIEACREAGVARVVLNSALGAGDYDKSFPAWHRQVEETLSATGLASCVLRPNSFLQNLVTYYAPSIRAEGRFYAAMGGARTSYIDVRDIGAVAAAALQGRHDGKVYELNGPAAITCSEVAERITRHTGVTTVYVDIPLEAQRKAMIGQGMPEWQATALLDLQDYYVRGNGGATDGLLESLLGRPPITIDQFLTETASAFRA